MPSTARTPHSTMPHPPNQAQNASEPDAHPSRDGGAPPSLPAGRPRHSTVSWVPAVMLALLLLITIFLYVVSYVLLPLSAYALIMAASWLYMFAYKYVLPAVNARWEKYELELTRRVAPDRHALRAQDGRAPILYLRSFADDELSGQSSYRSSYYFRLNTEEEELISILEEQGPTDKLAGPGDARPKWGATPLRASESDWQSTVTELMTRAQLVVLRAGMSGGLLWELQQAAHLVSPERLLILIPYDEQEYELFRRQAEEYLPGPLPDYLYGDVTFGSLQGAVYFTPDWAGHFLTFESLIGDKSEPNKISTVMRLTLRPVYEQLGWHWSAPTVNAGIVPFIILFAVIGSCLFVSFLAVLFDSKD
ncbi:MAG: hypothetical protein ABW208_26575 [Pyrinomonadaceae bacterium]